ncbi:MAG: GntR family transcriptional regulator [Clostridiales bacterium]|nr:GntR family transcriptional regulator [Clostridiales bacterium]
MNWELDDKTPIYLQIIEKIRLAIISGIYKPGDKLPSVRDLAVEASVNPNTMQKALSELENKGLLYSQRTAGRFITDDTELISSLRGDKARTESREYIQLMKQLGLSRTEVIDIINELMEESL